MSNNTEDDSFVEFEEKDEENDEEIVEKENEANNEEMDENEDSGSREENGFDERNTITKSSLDEAEVGIVEKIEVINFMCHKHLEISFCPHINFIVGRNGSLYILFSFLSKN